MLEALEAAITHIFITIANEAADIRIDYAYALCCSLAGNTWQSSQHQENLGSGGEINKYTSGMWRNNTVSTEELLRYTEWGNNTVKLVKYFI